MCNIREVATEAITRLAIVLLRQTAQFFMALTTGKIFINNNKYEHGMGIAIRSATSIDTPLPAINKMKRMSKIP